MNKPAPARDMPISALNLLSATLRRAHAVSVTENICAVVAGAADHWRRSCIKDLPTGNVFIQPSDHGTAYEILLALLHLDARVGPETPIIFLPADHIVSDEDVINRALVNLVQSIVENPHPVYLLGAEPEGPHDQLGYIVPWYSSLQLATGVYEFVERPDARHARKLINAGGLWNTFILGGTLHALIDLFRARHGATVGALRAILRGDRDCSGNAAELCTFYRELRHCDFSLHVLADQTDRLSVLRMPPCGWWPVKSPSAVRYYG